ncbi:MAG TPA: ABC transporter ATP-binding protein [Vicinamibacterales bacterium]
MTALVDVGVTLYAGEVLGLIGPNGSGKTTLLECLAGVLASDGGAISAEGHAITAAERSSLLFYLPDAIAPWPAQTVRWALDFTGGFFGANGSTPNAPDELLRRLDLGPLLDVAIGELSKGQRKRTLLAIALLMPHPVLLLDEPFEGLDLRQSRDVGQLLRDHARAGRTLFLSIHQINEAARVCDRFVLLSQGRVCGEGTLEELAGLVAARDGAPKTLDLEQVFLALT